MEELTSLLNNVEDKYSGFLIAVEVYAKKKKERQKTVINFMNNNPDALSSDILEFISNQEDFYEDAY